MTGLAKISHYGVVRLGEMEAEAVVLEDGRRGFIGKQISKVLGYTEKTRSGRFDRFLAEFAPKYMNGKEKAGLPVLNPGKGGRAQFIEAEGVMEAIDNVIDAACTTGVHKQQQNQVLACLAIRKSLGMLGLVALIDEATGYQYHRAPDALQDLIGKLIRLEVKDWERRFEPEYYRALAKVTGTPYTSGANGRPPIWGAITRKWVYEACFPEEVIAEISARQGVGEKLHQWLSDGGIHVLMRQKDHVKLLAETSANYKDFEARCMQGFPRPGQIGIIYPEAA